ncbi:hypothetical protein Tco_1058221 [Tanacetum coccineum]|uniref:Uncharacterized protein n=1 Tax=Tanacetum coccineum TaxID=301880 RepID=A0ABQ5H8X4_9ASTR
MMNEVKNHLSKFLTKVVSEVVQPRITTTVRDVLKMTPITLYQPPSTSTNSLTEYQLELKLYNMMQASRSFLYHEKHLTLYNALMNSIDVDEANVQGTKDTKKRRHNKQDPPVDADKDSKNRKRKNADTSSSKKGKTQCKSSKEAKAPTKPSASDKAIDDEELRQDDAVDDSELVKDDDMTDYEMPHDDDPTQDRSKWFKQDEVVRPKTPNPEWFKEPNRNDAYEQPWFNEMVNVERDQQDFDNLMGSTVDFTKFIKNRLKKDKITKAELEGPAFKLLKGERDRCPYDLSKPLPLKGRPVCRTTKYWMNFFFNQDLEYLKTGKKDKKYAVSLTKLKAACIRNPSLGPKDNSSTKQDMQEHLLTMSTPLRNVPQLSSGNNSLLSNSGCGYCERKLWYDETYQKEYHQLR